MKAVLGKGRLTMQSSNRVSRSVVPAVAVMVMMSRVSRVLDLSVDTLSGLLWHGASRAPSPSGGRD